MVSAAIAVDVGGTFTDLVGLVDGKVVTGKIPSRREDAHQSVVDGAQLSGVLADATIFNHASTHGLNAVLTRRLPKVAFLGTEGHRDILDLARIWRPWSSISDPAWQRSFGDVSKPLVPRYLRRAIVERLDSSGRVVVELDEDQVRRELRVLAECGVEAIAVCLLHAYVDGAHERRVRDLVLEVLGELPVSISSEVSPLVKEYPRASTAVIDVCMKVIYGDYTTKLRAGLEAGGFQGTLNYADSAAMLMTADAAMQVPHRIVFAGPAAGTAASVHFGGLTDRPDIVCADVGGTSCDISVISSGQAFLNTTFELEHDLVVNSLSTDIVSIGAGGGSLVTVNALGELCVGPGSAGSQPGPACYGQGGTQPTVTDLALLIGILSEKRPLGERVALRADFSRDALDALDTDLDLSTTVRNSWQLALNNITQGIFNVALKHGADLRDYSLFAFGAAGPMLLPSILDETRLKNVVVPPHPGFFSAMGLLTANNVYTASRTSYRVLEPENATAIASLLEELCAAVESQANPAGEEQVRLSVTMDGHLVGQSWETPFVPVPLPITEDSIEALVTSFHDAYERRNGKRFENLPVQAVTFRAQLEVLRAPFQYPELSERGSAALEPSSMLSLHHLYGADVEAPEYERAHLCRGDSIEGPAIVREPASTTFVPAGRVLLVGTLGELIVS